APRSGSSEWQRLPRRSGACRAPHTQPAYGLSWRLVRTGRRIDLGGGRGRGFDTGLAQKRPRWRTSDERQDRVVGELERSLGGGQDDPIGPHAVDPAAEPDLDAIPGYKRLYFFDISLFTSSEAVPPVDQGHLRPRLAREGRSGLHGGVAEPHD